MVSVLAFYSDDPSLNTATVNSFLLFFEKIEKGPGLAYVKILIKPEIFIL